MENIDGLMYLYMRHPKYGDVHTTYSIYINYADDNYPNKYMLNLAAANL